MATTKAVIDISINTSDAAAQIRQLQTQINAFNATLNKNSAAHAQASRLFADALVQSVNVSQAFTAEQVRMETAARRLDQTLVKGRGSLGQYFSARFRKDSADAAAVLSLANERAAALQTQFVKLSSSAGGFRDAIAIRPLQALNDSMDVANQKAAIHSAMFRQATTSMINFGKNTQWAGRQLMVGFTVPLTIFGAAAGKTFQEIEQAAVRFKKVYGDAFTTPAEIEENMKAVQGLALEFTKYGIAVKDTIGLAAEAAAAGAQNADLIAATTEATRLATLGQMEQQEALTATIALQNAFKLSSQDLGKEVNFLNMVENQTVVTLQDLAEAIPRVAPVIVGLGGDVRDMAAMLAAMQEGGVSAAQGANALKSGLGSLINPTEKASKVLGEMGINLNAIVQANRGDLMGTVKAFGQALSGLDQFTRQQALEELFGKYQYARLGALFDNIVKDGTQASRVLQIAGLSAEQMAKSAEKELSVISEATSTKYLAAMERFKLAIAPVGEMFMKISTPIINFFSKLFEMFDKLPEGAKTFAAFAALIVGVVVPAGTMFLGLLMNLLGTLAKFGHVIGVAVKGFGKGGFSGAIQAVSQSLRYMGVEEITASTAAQQLGMSTAFANEALLNQVSAAGNATIAIDRLADAYSRLITTQAGIASGRDLVFGAGAAAATSAAGGTPRVRPQRRNSGGKIKFMSGGGSTVPGFGNTDTVPAMLTPGEFVVNKQATQQNLPLLHAINGGMKMPGFNKGGKIPGVKYLNGGGPTLDELLAAYASASSELGGSTARQSTNLGLSLPSSTRTLDMLSPQELSMFNAMSRSALESRGINDALVRLFGLGIVPTPQEINQMLRLGRLSGPDAASIFGDPSIWEPMMRTPAGILLPTSGPEFSRAIAAYVSNGLRSRGVVSDDDIYDLVEEAMKRSGGTNFYNELQKDPGALRFGLPELLARHLKETNPKGTIGSIYGPILSSFGTGIRQVDDYLGRPGVFGDFGSLGPLLLGPGKTRTVFGRSERSYENRPEFAFGAYMPGMVRTHALRPIMANSGGLIQYFGVRPGSLGGGPVDAIIKSLNDTRNKIGGVKVFSSTRNPSATSPREFTEPGGVSYTRWSRPMKARKPGQTPSQFAKKSRAQQGAGFREALQRGYITEAEFDAYSGRYTAHGLDEVAFKHSPGVQAMTAGERKSYTGGYPLVSYESPSRNYTGYVVPSTLVSTPGKFNTLVAQGNATMESLGSLNGSHMLSLMQFLMDRNVPAPLAKSIMHHAAEQLTNSLPKFDGQISESIFFNAIKEAEESAITHYGQDLINIGIKRNKGGLIPGLQYFANAGIVQRLMKSGRLQRGQLQRKLESDNQWNDLSEDLKNQVRKWDGVPVGRSSTTSAFPLTKTERMMRVDSGDIDGLLGVMKGGEFDVADQAFIIDYIKEGLDYGRLRNFTSDAQRRYGVGYEAIYKDLLDEANKTGNPKLIDIINRLFATNKNSGGLIQHLIGGGPAMSATTRRAVASMSARKSAVQNLQKHGFNSLTDEEKAIIRALGRDVGTMPLFKGTSLLSPDIDDSIKRAILDGTEQGLVGTTTRVPFGSFSENEGIAAPFVFDNNETRRVKSIYQELFKSSYMLKDKSGRPVKPRTGKEALEARKLEMTTLPFHLDDPSYTDDDRIRINSERKGYPPSLYHNETSRLEKLAEEYDELIAGGAGRGIIYRLNPSATDLPPGQARIASITTEGQITTITLETGKVAATPVTKIGGAPIMPGGTDALRSEEEWFVSGMNKGGFIQHLAGGSLVNLISKAPRANLAKLSSGDLEPLSKYLVDGRTSENYDEVLSDVADSLELFGLTFDRSGIDPTYIDKMREHYGASVEGYKIRQLLDRVAESGNERLIDFFARMYPTYMGIKTGTRSEYNDPQLDGVFAALLGPELLKNKGGLIPIQQFSNGGDVAAIKAFATKPLFESANKTFVPGVGNRDTVPAALTPGEFVINKKATAENLPLLQAINGGSIPGFMNGGLIPGVQHFASGGLVGNNIYGYDERGRPVRDANQARSLANQNRLYNDAQQRQKVSLRTAERRINTGGVPPQTPRVTRNTPTPPTPTTPPRQPRMGGGRMGVSTGIGALGGAMMMAPMIPGVAQNEGLTNIFTMGGMGLSALSMLAMLPLPIAAVAAALTAVAAAGIIVKKNFDELARTSAKTGSELGGSANRMQKVSEATGYQFARQRVGFTDFRFTKQEKENAGQFADYFANSDQGKKMIDDLKKLSPEKRYKEVASIISMAIADGMDTKTAKAYGDAIAYFTNDAMMKFRLTSDIKGGKFKKGSDAMISLIDTRLKELEKIKIPEPPKEVSSPVSRALGTTGSTNLIAEGALSTLGPVHGMYKLITDTKEILESRKNIFQGYGIVGEMANIGAAFKDLDKGKTIRNFISTVPIFTDLIPAGQEYAKTVEASSMAVGSSMQVLKELDNAEALLIEERKKGIIGTEEYGRKLEKLRAIQDSAAKSLEQAFTLNQDFDLSQQAISDQLVMAGFTGDLSAAVSRQINGQGIGTSLFGQDFNLAYASVEQKDIIGQVMAEVLAGITPENAEQKIGEIKTLFAHEAEALLAAAADGLTSAELSSIILKSQIENFVEDALTLPTPENLGIKGRGAFFAKQYGENLRIQTNLNNLEQDGAFQDVGGIETVLNRLASFEFKDFARNIAMSANETTRLVSFMKELDKYKEIDVEIIMKTSNGMSAEETAKAIEKTLKDINKLKLKGISKEIKNALPSPQSFINLARNAGIEFDKISERYKKVAEDTSFIQNELDPKKTGKIKTKQLTREIIFKVFGEDVKNPENIIAALQAAFPETMDPMLIPLVFGIQNPEVLSLLAAGGPIAADLAKAIAAGQGSFEYTPTIDGVPGGVLQSKILDLGTTDSGKISGASSPSGSSGGGGGTKSILQQLKDQFKQLQDIYNGMAKFINSKTGLFKGIAAGPFGPQFIEFLKSQGEEGIKILNGNLEKFKQVYNEFVKVQRQSVKNAFQNMPSAFRAQANLIAGQRELQNKFAAQGISKTQSEAMLGMIGEGATSEYGRLTAKQKAGKKLSKKELASMKDFERNLPAVAKQAKVLDIETLITTRGELQSVLDYANNLDIPSEFAEKLTEAGIKMNTLGTSSANTYNEIKQIATLENQIQISDKFKEMNEDITVSENIMRAIPGATNELIDSLKTLGVTSITSDDAIRKAAEGLVQYRLESERLKGRLTNLSEEFSLLSDAASAEVEKINKLEIAPIEKEIDKLNKSISNLEKSKRPEQTAIDKLREEEQAIQKVYDERVKALDEIQKANDRIAAQQKGQMDVASALSRGDIAGAAQAALELQRTMAQQRVEDTKSALQQQNESEREAIAAKIKTHEDNIKNIDQQILALQDSIAAKQDLIEKSKEKQAALEEKIYKYQLLRDAIETRRAAESSVDIGEIDIYKKIMEQQRLTLQGLGLENIPGGAEALKLLQQPLANEQYLRSGQQQGASAQLMSDVSKSIQDALPLIDEAVKQFIDPKTGLPKELNDVQETISTFAKIFGVSAESLQKFTSIAENYLNTVKINGEKDIRSAVANAINQIKAANQAAADNANTKPKNTTESKKYFGGIIYKAFGGMIGYKGSREPAPGMMYGGKIKKFAAGSFVPGIGSTDKVPALLTPGEFVVRKPVAQAYRSQLEALNGQVNPQAGSGVYPGVPTRYRSNGIDSLVSIGSLSSFNPFTDLSNVDTSVVDLSRVNANTFPVITNISSDSYPVDASYSNSQNVLNSFSPVQYTYNVSVNAETNANPDEIANAVMYRLRAADSRRVRGGRVG